eukprot:Pgem_evm1s8989
MLLVQSLVKKESHETGIIKTIWDLLVGAEALVNEYDKVLDMTLREDFYAYENSVYISLKLLSSLLRIEAQ